ncbi:MAG: AraC family transcriptional regulator [Verrucomicrobiota bacterium]
MSNQRTGTGRDFSNAFFRQHPGAESVIELFEFLPSVLFYAKDCDHRYIGVNGATLTRVFGLDDIEQLLGRTDLEFQPPLLAEAYHAEDRRVLEECETIPNQLWLVPHVNGTPQWYVSTKTPLRDPDGTIIGLAGAMYAVETPAKQKEIFRELLPVIRHIEKHFTKPISMEAMAELAGLSKSHFNARFREVLRMPPSQFLLARRVEYARRLLTQTSKDLIDIATEAGFFDQSHFTKRFRKVTGLTPKEYRKRFR